MKPDGAEYDEMVLCNVDDVLAVSDMPMRTMDGDCKHVIYIA